MPPREQLPPVRVVLCDDAVEFRELTQRVFEEDPAIEIVGQAGGVDEVLEVLGRTRPDVILLDVSMPGGDGVEALPAVRAAAPRARVIMLSGSTPEGLRERALERGAVAFFSKSEPLRTVREQVLRIARS
jgi:DNA-binding NarL/FixJ family response regulator